jgi:hypothetical protein
MVVQEMWTRTSHVGLQMPPSGLLGWVYFKDYCEYHKDEAKNQDEASRS